MAYQRIQQSSAWNPPMQAKTSQFAPRPFGQEAPPESVFASRSFGQDAPPLSQFAPRSFGPRLSGAAKSERASLLQRALQARSAASTSLLSQQPLSQQPATEASSESTGNRVIQTKADITENSQVNSDVSRPNKTGLPDQLKTGIEHLSGYSLDNVRVHYNSPKPTQLQALAYTQGTDIHVAPGQERHLPHEGWHVVQQMQGRVRPTMQMKGVGINDDVGLEREADVMGAKAASGVVQTVWQRAKPVSRNYRPTVQCVVGALAHSDSLQLVGNSQGKFEEVIDMLNMNLLPRQHRVIYLKVDNHSESNPAETNVNEDGNIEIGIRKWYIDISSVGEILGLIAHELGVHNLGDMIISSSARRRERRRNRNRIGFQVNVNGHEVAVAGWNAAEGTNWDVRNRQRDHVNVVRDSGGVVGNASARTRAYVTTMLTIGDNIANAPNTGADEQNQKLRDLLHTFLFDYSRILVTDDGPARSVFYNAAIISEVMEWYQNVIIQRYAGEHDWLNRHDVQVNTGGWWLRSWLLRKLSQYGANRVGNIIQR